MTRNDRDCDFYHRYEAYLFIKSCLSLSLFVISEREKLCYLFNCIVLALLDGKQN